MSQIELINLQSKMVSHRAKGNELQRKMLEVEKGNYDRKKWMKEYEQHRIDSMQILNEVTKERDKCQKNQS